MQYISKELAQNYYEECLKIHSFNLPFSRKVVLFQQVIEHDILKGITGKTEFYDQFSWLKQNEVKREYGKIIEGAGSIPNELVSDIDNLKKWRNVGEHDDIMTKIKYLSHLETMARTIKFFSGVRFPDKINDILSDNQETYDELPYDELSRRGNRCYQNAKFSDALEYYEKAETKVHTDKDKEIDLYQKMADTYKKIGEYAKALSHYRKALDNCILLDSNESFKTAKLYQRIGDVLRKDSQYEKAKENFDKSIEILTKIQKEDPNDPDVASLYNDFGLMYLNEKKHEAAQLYYEDAYNIRENNFKKYGKEERQGYYAREYAYSVHNMGTYYYKKVEDRVFKTKDEKDSCLKKASEFHERAYNLRMDLLNGDDPIDAIKEKSSMASLCQDIAQSLTLWASDLLELGKEKKALEKCEKGLKIREAMQGTNIQDIAWSYYTMGLINYELKKNDAALKCFSESYRIRLKASNDKHPYAAKALYKMGLMKSILNSDKKDALQDLKKALGIQKDFLKKDDPELLDTVKLINELEKDQKEAAI